MDRIKFTLNQIRLTKELIDLGIGNRKENIIELKLQIDILKILIGQCLDKTKTIEYKIGA